MVIVAEFKVYFNLHGQVLLAKDSITCINLWTAVFEGKTMHVPDTGSRSLLRLTSYSGKLASRTRTLFTSPQSRSWNFLWSYTLCTFGIVFLYGLKLLRLFLSPLPFCLGLCWPKEFFLTLKRSWKHPLWAQETKQKLQLLWVPYLFCFCPFSKAKSSSKSF